MKKRIGIGTWSWGNKLFWNYKSSNDDDLRETYNEALERGFDLIDTADSYGTGNYQGRSESLIGKFLLDTPSAKKKRIQIATKLAPYPWRIGDKGFNKPFLKSLERLNNKLDIVQLHWSTAKYNPYQELGFLNNLCDLKDQGFDFQIGLSNIGPKRLQKLINYLSIRDKNIQSVQIQFSLLAPDLQKQYQVKNICEENNIDFFAYSPLSFGILCIDPDKDENKERSFIRNLLFENYKKSTYELRRVLKSIAKQRSVSQAQVAVNWCCYQGTIPLVGMRKKSQVIDISNVFKWNLNKNEFNYLQEISRKCLKKMPNNPFTSV
ncbi:aldo/keto reductase [uncultured Prochlorococcus sp.]|uniref:aldo/keto reductase n=1 Tax=uncultured Prochlorococcus sp. TaxID=159733 RepID=UPI0025829B35|nr:aldo/keto reductase [uncultured Prochlorococcus sp.]